MVDFKDFRSFLKAALAERRRIGRHLGLRALARAVGMSESHLSNVVLGRRGLDPAVAGDLAQALGLEGPRWRYFVRLVELEATTSPGARIALRRELEALREELAVPRRRGRPTREELEQRARRLERLERQRYVRTWLNSALFALISCPDAPVEVRSLARQLRRVTLPTAVLASLADLRALGLVVERDGRHWATADVADAERPDEDPPDRHVYHAAWELARDGLLAREPGTVVRVSLMRLRAPEEPEQPMQAFREAFLAGEPSSDSACVTLERPTLPADQEPATVVLQQAVMVARWGPER